MATLTLIEGTPGTEQAAREAWGHVLDGFRRALAISDLPEETWAVLRRCHDYAAECADQPTIGAV